MKRILLMLLASGGALLPTAIAWAGADSPAPGTVIQNQATGSYTEPSDGSTQLIESNVVEVTVAEVAGITVQATNLNEPIDGTVNAGDSVFVDFVITNVGNDPTQFVIPGIASVTNGTQVGSIQVIEYNAGGTDPVVDLSGDNITIPSIGDTSGNLLNGITDTNDGVVPAGGSITVRVEVTAGAAGNDLTVTLGDTAVDGEQNEAYVAGTNDVYTQDNLDTDEASNGAPINGEREAEDSVTTTIVAVTGEDYGDAPDSYGTDATDDGGEGVGPSHTIVSGIYLGAALPDSETDAQLPLDGTGDGADEDGVQLNGVSLQGQNITRDATTTLEITTTGNGVLNAWFDWNGNGSFNDPGEQVATDDALVGGTLNVSVPAGATRGTSYARFRYSSDTGLGPTGAASDGEVEDYQIVISDQFIDDTPSSTSCSVQGGTLVGANLYLPLDGGTMGFEDGSPDQSPTTDPYPTEVTGGTYAQYGSGTGPFFNPGYGEYSYVANIHNPRNTFQHDYTVDPVYGVTGRFFASDPDNTDTPVMTLDLTGLTPNQFYEYSFWAANSEPDGASNEIDIFIDGQSVFSTGPLPKVTSGLLWTKYTFTFTNGTKEDVELQLASTQIGQSGNDFYLDNIEVRECQFAIDYGDAPASYGDALHTTIPTTPTVYLGAAAPDSESATLLGGDAGVGADGDDTTDNNDENTFTLTAIPSTGTYDLNNIPVTNTSDSDTTLHAWIDFDQDGKFSASEYQSTTIAAAIGATTANLSWTVPAGFTPGETYARFRITQNDLIEDNATTTDVDERSQSAVINGEVEDYFIPVASDPNLILAKRITAIDRDLADEQLFDTSYVDSGTTTDEDNEINWPGAATPATIGGGSVESYIAGIINGADSSVTTLPGDQIEYTIPFLSNGDIAAQDVLICDRIPENTTFVLDSFNSSPPAGAGFGDHGILVEVNGSQVALTNTNDGDEIADSGGNDNGIGGYYFDPGVDPTTVFPDISCNGTSDNGTVVVDLSDVPNATGEGIPTDSYGFIRFRVAVD